MFRINAAATHAEKFIRIQDFWKNNLEVKYTISKAEDGSLSPTVA